MSRRRSSRAWGVWFVVCALLAIIGFVGYLVVGLAERGVVDSARQPLPANVPPAVAAPQIDMTKPGRTAELLRGWAVPLSTNLDIPLQAMMAYGNAEVYARATHPQCNLSWNTLAGIGYVETRHGSYDGRVFGGAELDDEGNATPPIIGPQLNGKGFAEIGDTDEGRIDGDKKFDRAVGPMQFIPESWRRYGVDANGDGVANPQNIDDAAAAAANLLCAHDRDVSTPEGWNAAVRSYNQSNAYVRDVHDAAANYALDQRPS